jgi:hypothetical protein
MALGIRSLTATLGIFALQSAKRFFMLECILIATSNKHAEPNPTLKGVNQVSVAIHITRDNTVAARRNDKP